MEVTRIKSNGFCLFDGLLYLHVRITCSLGTFFSTPCRWLFCIKGMAESFNCIVVDFCAVFALLKSPIFTNPFNYLSTNFCNILQGIKNAREEPPSYGKGFETFLFHVPSEGFVTHFLAPPITCPLESSRTQSNLSLWNLLEGLAFMD